MSTLKRILLPTTVVLLSATASGAGAYRAPEHVPETGIGFRGDGTGVFPNSRPPIKWDGATGKGILWKAELPNWGYCCPVPVGNRVFFMSEPGWKSTFPELVCYDADTGEMVWKKEVSPFDAFPQMSAQERQKLTEDIQWVHEGYRQAYRICGPLAERHYVPRDDPQVAGCNKELAKYDLHISGYKKGYGLLRKIKYTSRRRKDIDKSLRKYGVVAETTWGKFGSARVGACFPTPVSDAEHVYVMTRYGTVACYDMGGRLVWTKSANFKGHHGLMASPRLYGNLLITAWMDTGQFDPQVVAYDKRNGREVWRTMAKARNHNEGAGSRPGGATLIMKLGETPVVVVSTGRILRLADGKLYESSINPSCGTYAVDEESDTIFGCGHTDRGSKRWGLNLELKGDALQVTDRYSVKKAYGPTSSVFADGRLFTGYTQLDPNSGMPVGKPDWSEKKKLRDAPRTAPRTRHLLLVAGGHVYGLYEKKPRRGEKGPREGIAEVFTLDGRKAAENSIPAATLTPAQKEKWDLQGFGNNFSYSCSMNIGGNRLYICSQDYLYCIGSGPAVSAARVTKSKSPAKSTSRIADPQRQEVPSSAQPSRETVARWEPALMALISHQVRAGAHPRFRLSQSNQRVTIAGVEDGKLVLKGRGIESSYALADLDLHAKASIAGQVADGSSAKQAAVAAFFYLAAGRESLGSTWLASAGRHAGVVRKSLQAR